jgi:phasin family protein
MGLLQRSIMIVQCGVAQMVCHQEVPMGPKSKKTAIVPTPPQPDADRAHRIARAPIAARGYYDQLASLSQENFDAMLKANAALAEGFEAIANEAVGCARQTLATAGTATKELLAAKTLDRVIEIHAGLAKSALETLVERSTRLSELGLALANDTWAPIAGRFETITKLARPIAA